jgi:hypothetical protein
MYKSCLWWNQKQYVSTYVEYLEKYTWPFKNFIRTFRPKLYLKIDSKTSKKPFLTFVI